jgi:hypothetical protein
MYEMPANMVCGNCGMCMISSTPFFDEEMRKTGIAKYHCVNSQCSDKDESIAIKLKVHERVDE